MMNWGNNTLKVSSRRRSRYSIRIAIDGFACVYLFIGSLPVDLQLQAGSSIFDIAVDLRS